MKNLLNKIISKEYLTASEAESAISLIANENTSPLQTAAFLMGIQQRGITVSELSGFRNGMLNLALNLDFSDFETIDVCGTGGDGKDTFNISTTSAFIVAGAGVLVAKHGNHGVSSAVGSSTVLEYLGVKFTNHESQLKHKLETGGICYLHAPLFHPAMKVVAPIRKGLGIKTFFNILGPLLNPARVKTQLTGVSDLKTFELYKAFFADQNGNFGVVHALDGYDEISLTGDFRVAKKQTDKIFSPNNLGFELIQDTSLSGGKSLEDSAKILRNILEKKGTKAQNSAVIANAGLAISIAKEISFEEGIALAKESLGSGKALKSFKKLIE